VADEKNDPRAVTYIEGKFDKLEINDPVRISRAFLNHHRDRPMRYYQGAIYRFEISHDIKQSEAGLRSEVYKYIEYALLKPNSRLVSEVIDALKAQTFINENCKLPWNIKTNQAESDMIAFLNGFIKLNDENNFDLKDHDSNIFNTSSANYKYNPALPEPEQMLNFLNQLWGDDFESIEAMQEWFGYCLTRDTRQQKMIFIIGPKRSGKGTLGRVIREVIGVSNTTAITLSGLGSPFGLAGLINKNLAIISDARLGKYTDVQVVAERLLSGTGEDLQAIPRKFMVDWVGNLTARYMWLANELPRIGDAGTALGIVLFISHG